MSYGVFVNRINDSLFRDDGIYFNKVGGFIMPRAYISPSTQEHNIGVPPFTNEESQMNKIADILIPLLVKDGRFITKCNDPSIGNVYSIARDSNNFKADIHVAIHSNAGGGEGTEVYAYGPGTNSERFAKCLYKHIAPLSPGADRGIKYNPKLIEVGSSVKATSALIELAFHDNIADAKWIATNYEVIALELYKGICDYYEYEYRETKGEGDVLGVAVLLFTKEDYWAGADVAVRNGNCGMFIRPFDQTVPPDAWIAKKLIVIGGPTTGHPNEVLLRGDDKYDTATAVKDYLG